MKILLTAINAKYIHSNPAVYSLKAYSEAASPGNAAPEIIIREYTINHLLDDILDDIYSLKPDIIAFSCYIWNIAYIDMLIPELKKLLPDTDIWCGGPEVSYRSAEYIESHGSCISGVINGEGEATFSELVQAYSKANTTLSHTDADKYRNTWAEAAPYTGKYKDTLAGSTHEICGITYRRKDGKIISTPMREPVELDTIPFLYKDLTHFDNRIIYYESSRGCPFSCSYCLSSIDKQLRYRSISLVKQELDFFLEHRVPQVKFIDRTFNCNPKRATEIWQYIHDNDNGVTNFHFEIAGDLLSDVQIELLSKFRPGLIQFEIGVQSTNHNTLRSIHRVSRLELLRDNVEKIRNGNNIHLHLDLIAGLPEEDLASFRSSFNQVYSMQPSQLQLGFLKVLSGSYIKEHSTDYGIVYRNYPPYEVLYTSCLSRDDMLLLKRVENMVEIFYNSHQFDNSINYLEALYESPFDLYESLGSYYEKYFDKRAKHSRISRYNFLLDFYKSIAVDSPKSEFTQRLTLDVYLRENMKSRPEFSCDLSIFHKNIIELKKKYNLSNHEHIEVFEIKAGEPVYVHFDYTNRNPLTNGATLHRLTI